jgi:DDE superfamily endonuclease
MEDVLSLYARPYDALHPVVCFDEKPYQLLSNVQDALPAKPGFVKCEDYEYRREGTTNLFVAFEPLKGQRVVEVTDQRCARDFADQMNKLAARYPQAVKIHLVLDNLSTHSPAALYRSMPPGEARALLERFEFHFTPKHGSWLNMAEIEWSVFERQCLGQRIPSKGKLVEVATSWSDGRNDRAVMVQWRFGVVEARVRLARLYPKLDNQQ